MAEGAVAEGAEAVGAEAVGAEAEGAGEVEAEAGVVVVRGG